MICYKIIDLPESSVRFYLKARHISTCLFGVCLYFYHLMYTYGNSKLPKIKLIQVLMCEAIVYPWFEIKFYYATVFYANIDMKEMLQKHVEVFSEDTDGSKNLNQVVPIFLRSHVLGDHLRSMTMLLRSYWGKIIF